MRITEISSSYRKPVLQAAALSIVLVILSIMVLDLGETASATPLALIAFWSVTILIVARRPAAPTYSDIRFIRFGSLWVFLLAQILARGIWYLRGVEF